MKGHIRRRGKSSWAIIIDLPRDDDGKRKRKWYSVKGKKSAAEKELRRLLGELDDGTFVEPSEMTISQYLDDWLETSARMNVAGKTFERYKEICDTHLKPSLGKRLLQELQPLQIQRYYAEALTSGRRDGEGGLSPQTVLHHHRLLREALQQAVKWRLVARNVADAVDPPKPVRREMTALTAEEMGNLLKAADSTRLRIPILLALTCGLRRGEVLALRWSDVDLDAGKLHIRQTLEETREGLRFKPPKTDRSTRVVALPQVAIAALRTHRARQAEERLLFGEDYQVNDLVNAEPDGGVWAPERFTGAYRRFAKRVKCKTTRFHDLRHSHATLCLKQDIHPKIVSERLGHSSIAITLDTYSHVLPDMQESAAQKIDDVFSLGTESA